MPETPCHGDIFHIHHQFKQVSNRLDKRARAAIARCLELEQQRARAQLAHRMTRRLTVRLMYAKRKEQALISFLVHRYQNALTVAVS